MQIWKYPFRVTDEYPLILRKGAIARHVGVQNGVPMLWVSVDPEAEPEDYRVKIVGTGHPYPDAIDEHFVGTFQQTPFVWHVFLLAEPDWPKLS